MAPGGEGGRRGLCAATLSSWSAEAVRRHRWLPAVLVLSLALAALALRFGPTVARLFEPVTDVFPAADAGSADEPY